MSVVLIVFLAVVGLALLACVLLGCSALRMAGLVAEDERRQADRDLLAGVDVEWSPLPIPDDDTARSWFQQPNPRGDLR